MISFEAECCEVFEILERTALSSPCLACLAYLACLACLTKFHAEFIVAGGTAGYQFERRPSPR